MPLYGKEQYCTLLYTPLYWQAVITDEEQGLFYTVGGTSGFNYFMDVNVLDLRAQPPAWQSLYRLSGLEEEPEARYKSRNLLSIMRPGTSRNHEGR